MISSKVIDCFFGQFLTVFQILTWLEKSTSVSNCAQPTLLDLLNDVAASISEILKIHRNIVILSDK